MSKLKVGIIGANGYAGAELVRLLSMHDKVEIAAIHARSDKGKKISDIYPGFKNISNLCFEDEDSVINKSDFIFASLPHGLSEPLARKCIDANKKCIDLGADFRLENEEDYKEWYKLPYNDLELHTKSVYGLSEIHKDKITSASIIGNPGCYPTSIALGCYPILKADLVKGTHLIIDSKSGTTGAGKGLSETTHFARCNESFHAYKAGSHRHTPEIEQMLSEIASTEIKVTFVPHLLPISRGILSTIYLPLNKEMKIEEIHDLYKETYKDKTFVRILDAGDFADLKFVKYSNYCDISLHLDTRTNTLIVTSVIDNMVKGAAGQAIQNMNIMMGFEEERGLTYIAPSF